MPIEEWLASLDASSDHGVNLMWYFSTLGDPAEVPSYLLGAGNPAGYDNPAIVELNSQAQSTNDTAARKELYDRIQAEVPADSSLALLYYVPFGWVHSDAVQGFSVTPLGYVGLKDVTLAAQ